MSIQQRENFYTGMSTAYSRQANIIEDVLDGRITLDEAFKIVRELQLDAAKQTVRTYRGSDGE